MPRNINSSGRNGGLPVVVQESLVNYVKQQDERLLGVKRKTISGVSAHNSRRQTICCTDSATDRKCLLTQRITDSLLVTLRYHVSLKATSMVRVRRFCKESGFFRTMGTSMD
jgi:hypothetical protein